MAHDVPHIAKDDIDLVLEAFDLAPSMMGIVELAGDDVVHLRDNRSACAFFGLPPGGTSGRSARAMGVDAETVRRWLEHYRRSAASGETVRFEHRYAHEGEDRTMQVAVRKLGKGDRFLYVADDVTAQRRAEAAAASAEAERQAAVTELRRERDFSNAVLETAGALVVVIGRDGRITRFNRACERLTGRTAHEMLGREIWQAGLIPDEQQRGARQAWAALVRGELPNHHENDWLSTRGDRRTVAWSNTVIVGPSGDVEYVIATGLDITERRRDEARLRASERRFRELAEAMPQIVYVVREDGELEYLNGRWRSYTGASAFDLAAVVHPDDLPAMNASWQLAFRAGEPHSFEFRLRTGDRYRWFLSRCVPTRDDDGKALRWYGTSTDIDDLKRAHEALRASEERFQQFMQNCPAVAYIKDERGRYVWANARLARAVPDWQGVEDDAFVSATDVPQVRANDAAVLAAGTPMTFIESVTADHGPQHWLAHKFPISDARGVPLLAGMSVEITEQVRAREEVRRLNEELTARTRELETLLDLVPVAIFMTKDPEARRIDANRAAARLIELPAETGASPTALSGEDAVPYTIWRDGRELEPSEHPIHAAARGVEVRGAEYELRFENGVRKNIFGGASPIRDGGGKVLGGVAAFIDVTEPVRVRRRLATMFDTNLVGNIRWRIDGAVTEANDAFLTMLGYTREELPSISWRELTPPRWAEADRAALAALASRRKHPPFEKEYLDRSGRPVPVLVSSAFFPESEDEGISYIVDLRDVKRAEQRVRELFDQVTAASRAKDEFMATLAHELRNPLAPILNAVEILRAKGPPDPQLAWGRDVIHRQVRHMSRLLEDLLDVSRIARDKLELRKEPVTIASVVDAAVETSRPVIDAGRHRLHCSVPAGAQRIVADPVRLAQVVSNLLNNAAKYTPEGGHIELRVDVCGGTLEIVVRDDGIGIAPEMLPHVFDLFTQAAPGWAQGGLGIGLSLVRGIVQLHGGTVNASSEGPGRGSEFRVSLPDVALAAGTAEGGALGTTPALARRVLVVDDNEDSADTLVALLEIYGCEVAAAYTGAQALALAESFRPSAVLLDVGMPNMSGHEVAERLRAMPSGEELLIIAMTGWGQEDDRKKTRDAGFDHHLVKPLDPAALVELLARSSRA